jgi:ribosomal protein S18 acetylase RimI-like enzyme
MLHLLSSRKSEVTNKTGLKITPWQSSHPNFIRLLRQVLPIEARCFSRLHWTESNFLETFKLDGVAGAVAFRGKTTAGYLILYTVADETEIINLVVDEPLRRQGIGKSLIDYAAGVAAACGSKRLVANERETNLDG